MGTRSLTRVIEHFASDKGDVASTLVCMYRQMDGYPSGHGADLAEFLKGMKIVNGIGASNPKKIANGAGCLAAQLVAHFKDGPGSIYLYPADTTDAGQDYEYDIHISHNDGIGVTAYEPEYGEVGGHYSVTGRKTIFAGTVPMFDKFCHKKERKAA
jgi:hypothetical protein